MRRLRLLDLFCGIGGAAMGYYRAGFHVTGVDVVAHADYPFRLLKKDALEVDLSGYDVVHASPPCQAFSCTNVLHGYKHDLDLLTPIRARLVASGALWVIENVPGAPMRCDVVLCGQMFGLRLYRHRWFESNAPLVAPKHYPHETRTNSAGRGRGRQYRDGRHASVSGHNTTTGQAREAMGMDWGSRSGLTQAVPPAYTGWLGSQLHRHVQKGFHAQDSG